ncbi:MAG: TIGR01906 family membrane protein [Lachnospiraceae bacterium]|nr:TIGR01906 family membrane protein [Lachnospiraceae bacterium]
MRKGTLTPGNLLLALIGFLFFVSFSVTLVLNLRCIYYFDIDYLDLESTTGYSEEVIRRNYDALIDYNLVTKGVEELEFPDFPMSENAATHFEEVKRIFVTLQYLCVISGVVFLIGLCRCIFRKDTGKVSARKSRGRDSGATAVGGRRNSAGKTASRQPVKDCDPLRRRYGSLKLLSILTFLIPVVLGVCAAVNWDVFFVRFHELFFNNDYWLFDPATDPVILILPDEFFAHCAAAILLFLFLEGILTGMLYRFLTRSASSGPGGKHKSRPAPSDSGGKHKA